MKNLLTIVFLITFNFIYVRAQTNIGFVDKFEVTSGTNVVPNSQNTKVDFKVRVTRMGDGAGGWKPFNMDVKVGLIAFQNSTTLVEYLSPAYTITSGDFSQGSALTEKSYSFNVTSSKLKDGYYLILYYAVPNNGFSFFSQYSSYQYRITNTSTPTNPTNPTNPSYSNSLKSFVFYKNNCNPTSEDGSGVTYTVSAGTYSSTISQADADKQAENALFLYGQNYANNNGSCVSNPNKIIVSTMFPQVSDTFEVEVLWRNNNISSSTVSFEVYQYGVLKGTLSNIPNNGSSMLSIMSYLKIDGHTFRNVRLKIISDSNPNVFEYTPGIDWFVD